MDTGPLWRRRRRWHRTAASGLKGNEYAGPWRSCDGVYRYVGTTQTHRFLADRCVRQVAVTPDGDVWLTAGGKNNEDSVTTKLYLIPAESVATTDASSM